MTGKRDIIASPAPRALAVALVLAAGSALAIAPTPVAAQFEVGGSKPGYQTGSDRPATRSRSSGDDRMRGDRGGRDIRTGIGIGIDIIQEGLREQQDTNVSNDRDIKRGRKDDNKQPRRARRGDDDKAGPKVPPETPNGKKPDTPTAKETTTTTTTEKKTVKKHKTGINVTDNGQEDATVDIDCDDHKGKISVHTGVKANWLQSTTLTDQFRTNMISISYTGTGCDDCIWVQFLWSEVLITEPGKDPWRKQLYFSSSASPKAPVTPTTVEPKDPKYMLDSGSKIGVSYEGVGTANVTAESDTMFDQTSWPFDIAWRDKEGNYYDLDAEKQIKDVKIEWIDHFDTYLLCKNKICAKIHWQGYWLWDPALPDEKKVPDFHHPYKNVDGTEYTKPTISTTEMPTAGQFQTMLSKIMSGFAGVIAGLH